MIQFLDLHVVGLLFTQMLLMLPLSQFSCLGGGRP